jgi:hypothetical protein
MVNQIETVTEAAAPPRSDAHNLSADGGGEYPSGEAHG